MSIQELWQKSVEYAVDADKKIIEVGELFELKKDAPKEVKEAYDEYIKSVRHGRRKFLEW